MENTQPLSGAAGDLDVLGQQPFLFKLYTQLSSCYAHPSSLSQSKIIDTLSHGLERLTVAFPWVAGQVVNQAGLLRIVPFEKTPRLVQKDLTNDPSAPTMYDLRQASFPMRMLDESVFAPCDTLAAMGPATDPAPVFLLQVTFIKGGMVLTFAGQHNVMDMSGQGHLITALAKACRGEAFTAEELSLGNLPRRSTIALLDDDDYQPGSDLAGQIVKQPPGAQPSPPPKCSWGYFLFPGKSLAALKAKASATLSSGFVSTDDVLSALVWRAIARARQPRLEAGAQTMFGRAVDVRRHLGTAATYFGLQLNMAYSTAPLEALIDAPLGDAAVRLRESLAVDFAHKTRAMATYLDRTTDKNSVSVTASVDSSTDVMLSSWAALNSYELDFSLGLGKPEAVRRPQFPPVVESLIYLIPKAPDGEIAVAVCVRDEDMQRLREDRELLEHGRYVG